MKLSAYELYIKLTEDYGLVGKSGNISFTLKDLSIIVKTRDSVGNLIQEWLKAWLTINQIQFEENTNSQSFPDFLLDPKNHYHELLEVKSFDYDRGPGFDLANFDSYCRSLTEHAYRLDSNYLIFAYQMNHDGQIFIKNIWLKKIWELSSPSGTYPIKVQEKQSVIHNLRPNKWYSDRTKYKPFGSKEGFLSALNETRHRYPQTRHSNGHWLRLVVENYETYTGQTLQVDM